MRWVHGTRSHGWSTARLRGRRNPFSLPVHWYVRPDFKTRNYIKYLQVMHHSCPNCQLLSTTAFLFHCACPHSWNAPTYRSKLSLFCFVFFPIFASPPYLIFVIRPDICAYMHVPSRSDAAHPHLTQEEYTALLLCKSQRSTISDASWILHHSRGAPFSSRSLSITIRKSDLD